MAAGLRGSAAWWAPLSIALVTLAAVGVSRLVPGPQPAAPPHEATDRAASAPAKARRSDPSGLEQQLALLRAEVVGLKEQAKERAPVVPDSETTPQDEPEPAAPAPAPSPVTGAMAQALYDAAFTAQTMDASWARDERQLLSDSLAQEVEPGQRVLSVECRDTMCRVALQFDTPDARSKFVSRIGSPPFDRGGFYHFEPETKAFTLFTAREGRTLPALASATE